MHKPTPPLMITNSQRLVLQKLSKSTSAPYRVVIQAEALLLASRGLANTAIGTKLSVSPTSVSTWRKRFHEEGLGDFGKVKKGRGPKVTIPVEKIEEIIKLTQESSPEGQTHWSCRTMAQATGVSKDTVQRIWSSRGLKPHLVKSFKVSNDPKFEEKLVDVVGLYLNPPDNAVVLCMDEKSSIQAVDRTQPSLPIKKGSRRN